MSTPFCPRCGDVLQCACIAAHDMAAAGRAGASAQFDQEWVRPYLSLHEPAPTDGPAPTTVAWVVPQMVHESELPPGSERFGPPVVLVRPGSHRAHKPARRRRRLPLTAALATLIGSAALAGTYVLGRDQDSRDVTAPPPASRLDMVDEGETHDATPEPPRPPASLPGSGRPGAPSVARSLPSTAPSAARPAPSTPTSTASPASPAPSTGREEDDAGATPSPATSTTPVEKPTLRRRDSGPEVVDLQRRLARIGAWDLPKRGQYDQNLRNAVARFQAAHGVHGDPPGVYGPATRRLLEYLTP
ncbi:peptidoglycan-binding protein [Streptomyces sp. CA-243310]|uniref:peptidoglycan-binding domain-containing protein n=1 Tax=Streptomyces sp. CA-243310 TaxID=3240056 RepID=UPI003D8DC25B